MPEEIDDGCCCCSCRCWWLLSLSGGLCCWPGDQTPDFRHILERERERENKGDHSQLLMSYNEVIVVSIHRPISETIMQKIELKIRLREIGKTYLKSKEM